MCVCVCLYVSMCVCVCDLHRDCWVLLIILNVGQINNSNITGKNLIIKGGKCNQVSSSSMVSSGVPHDNHFFANGFQSPKVK